jgi:hypothetical protein
MGRSLSLRESGLATLQAAYPISGPLSQQLTQTNFRRSSCGPFRSKPSHEFAYSLVFGRLDITRRTLENTRSPSQNAFLQSPLCHSIFVLRCCVRLSIAINARFCEREVRAGIDKVDAELLKLLSQRYLYCSPRLR